MRTTLREVTALAAATVIALSLAGWAAEAPAQQPPSGAGGMMAPPDTNDPDVKALMALRAHIAGKEDMPADSVFENIKVFKGAKASRIPAVMGAFTRALGSHCSLCHAGGGKWASGEKKEKNIARGMMHMTAMLNDSLHAIANVDDDAHVSCSTCHRGKPKPEDPMMQRRPAGMGGPGGPGGPPPGGDHH